MESVQFDSTRQLDHVTQPLSTTPQQFVLELLLLVGRRFFFSSLTGMIFLTVGLAFVRVPMALEVKILNTLLAGIIPGMGRSVPFCTRSSLFGSVARL